MSSDDKKAESVREEFLAEAQEIVEALSRDLLILDQGQKDDAPSAELINEVFRGVHTLKGIAGMFGFAEVGTVAHALEDLLDDLRLGRVELTQSVLDVLFEGIESFQRLLGSAKDGGEGAEGLSAKRDAAAKGSDTNKDQEAAPQPKNSGESMPAGDLEDFDLGENVLSVLTEYEEHRLRTNVQQGVPLYIMHVKFSFLEIDTALEDLKARAKPLAEIITYLPSMGSGDADAIELDVLFASSSARDELETALSDESAVLSAVPRRNQTAGGPPKTSSGKELTSQENLPKGTSVVPPVESAGSIAASPRVSEHAARAPRDPSVDEMSLRSVSNSVRVDIRKLDNLMNVVGELAIVRSALVRLSERSREDKDGGITGLELHRLNRIFERHLSELQEGILDVRMVPLKQLFGKLARVVRQVAREHEKDVRLVVTGAETEIDKLIVEALSDPLMHLIRNAIDHGIEKRAVRELSGKPEEGILALNAYQKGNHVVIEIEDDGAGMNPDWLYETAVRRGIFPEGSRQELSNSEILTVIFAPGFTTSSQITDISGRGVGMDVVKTNISRIGGVIDVHSEQGTGSKFSITLPITLAILSALLVRICGRSYALPLNSVQEAILLRPGMIRTVEGREVITLRGGTLSLCHLDRHFQIERTAEAPSKQFVVVAALGSRQVGFVVDELEGQRDIVIKALGQSLKDSKGFAGATDLGDQTVALVLDLPAVMEELPQAAERLLQPGTAS